MFNISFTKTLILVFISVLFLSCQKKTDKYSNPFITNNKNEVVFIFDNSMKGIPISIFKKKTFVSTESLHVFSKNKNDTLSVFVKSYEKIYLATKFKHKDTLLVRRNDTVFIRLSDSILHYKIKRKKPFKLPVLKNELLYFKFEIDSITKRFYYPDYTHPLRLSPTAYELPSPLIPLKINFNKIKKNHKLLKKLIELKINYFNDVSNYYSSLSDEGLLEPQLKKLLVEEEEIKLYYELSFFNNYSKHSYLNEVLTSSLFINDSLINNRNEYYFLNNFLQKIVLKNKKTFSKSKVYINYKEAYDSLPKYLTGLLLKKSKIICLEQMPLQGETFNDIIKYFNHFNLEYSDITFASKFETKYLLKIKKLKNIPTEISLISLSKKKYELDSLIKRNKGNLIYIDFWASWCAPCRAAMPASKKLHKDYKNRGVTFMYISIDKNFNKWEKASNEEKLTFNKNNLLSINYPLANFYKKLRLNTIPRYLLYDKNGKLIHQDAPGPEGKDIRVLLDKYLNK